MGQRFTPSEPPKAGISLKLWIWFTNQAFLIPHRSQEKPQGVPPDGLYVIRPGAVQRNHGAASYEIRWQGTAFLVHEATETLNRPLQLNIADTIHSICSYSI